MVEGNTALSEIQSMQEEENILMIEPNIKQYQAMISKKPYVAYGGARGGGKSWFIDAKASLMARRYGRTGRYRPGIRICIVRTTLEDVRENHIEPLQIMLEGVAKFNQQKRTFFFPNGATIKFEYYQTDNDRTHFQGKQYDAIFIDEATNFKPEWLEIIAASCRGVNNFPHRIYFTCNPGGPGHAYIKRLFIDRTYREDENPDDYEFIQALVTDNTALMEVDSKYVNFLNHLPPKLKKAWRDGSWDVYEGQFFETFTNDPEHYDDQQWTHVINPFPIPKYWPIYRSFDWGYNKPFSAGYYTYYDGTLYRIAELYGVQYSGSEAVANTGVKWVPQKVFAEMQKMEKEHPLLRGREITGVADPAIWDAQYGESIAETAEKYGIFFEKGDHERIPGWMQCQYRLMFDDMGYPRFYVFNTCKEFIRTIVTLQYDEHKAEDLDSSGEDHAADEWRYISMKFLIEGEPPKLVRRPIFGSDPLDQYGGARQW